MEIEFLDAHAVPTTRLVAHVVNQDAIPAELEPVLAEAARASRFSGKAGQIFEGFVERGGPVGIPCGERDMAGHRHRDITKRRKRREIGLELAV